MNLCLRKQQLILARMIFMLVKWQFVKHLISLLNVKALVPDMVSSKSFLTKIFVTTILPKCELMGANSRTSVLFLPPQEEIEKSSWWFYAHEFSTSFDAPKMAKKSRFILYYDFLFLCERGAKLFWSLREFEPLMYETIDIILFIQNWWKSTDKRSRLAFNLRRMWTPSWKWVVKFSTLSEIVAKKNIDKKKWCKFLSTRDESKVPTMGIVMESEI